MNINLEEQKAYIKVLIYIASIDGAISEEELTFFTEKGEEIGISKEECETAVKEVVTDKEKFENIICNIKTEETKMALLEELISLCHSDGEYSMAEKIGMTDICISLGLDTSILKKFENKSKINNVKKRFDNAKSSASALGKKVVNNTSKIASRVANGIGNVGSKISLSIESAKKLREENKELRERLKEETISESVKQKVIIQLNLKIKTLTEQLKLEKECNRQNEEMIKLLKAQIDDLYDTVQVAEMAKTA